MSGSSSKSQYFSTHNEISRPVQRHLIHVYLVIAGMLGLATIGALYNSNQHPLAVSDGGVVGSVAAVGSALGVRHLPYGSIWRWVLLGTYALFSGISLSTLISVYTHWDPSGSLLLVALSSSVFIFLAFSASAMLANRRSLLYVSGMAGSLLGILIWASLANVLFFRSSSLFSAELYLGLIAFSGFVVYDTQIIVERASAGLLDVPGHALELFMDLFSLFIRLAMIILKKDQEREQQERRKRNNRQNFQRW
ncbi:Bax inhibitor 1 [Apophysomyces ossiformis]|uniref:Bax inhibitor 1 n=1 Tax=Apophysomyces ossiformis TaxID=679940 RepID=A0A8H7EUB7_9FUNG|nr:Bax inhibitor 1 [Apophysomyces ossiformis]